MTEKNNVTAVDDISAEQQTKPEKSKLTDADKLRELYVKRDKLIERMTAVKEQEKLLDKRIAVFDVKIRDLERKRLMEMCRQRNWTIDELLSVLQNIPEGVELNAFAKKFTKKAAVKEEHDDKV